MESSSATGQSMHSITTTKLAALSEKQNKFETEKARILSVVAATEDPATKVKVLLDAFKTNELKASSNISIANIERFLEQSKNDSAISSSNVRDWRDALEQALDVPTRKYQHASLFGRLVMEWLESPNNEDLRVAKNSSDTTEPFEHVGRKEMYEQRRQWESIVFSEHDKTSSSSIEAYLKKLFGSTTKSKKLIKSPLEELRKSLGSFKLDRVTKEMLKKAIPGILITDLLSEPKRKALSDFLTNDQILREIADVLNMQIDALGSWSWGENAVPVNLRRALNGKYRVYADEELIQAILLHHIGMSWAVFLKRHFLTFFNSGAWLHSTRRPLDAAARQLRHDFGIDYRTEANVRNERRTRFQDEHFLVQLPDAYENTTDGYSDTDSNKTKSPVASKQSLLHLLTTENVLQARLHQTFGILQSDFRWFGPSLPHSTILTVLRFFNVSPLWLGFFKKFLKAPLKFTQDGADAETRTRQCGVPLQHRLSDALSEAILFCLDFAVNKSTASDLYRMHDDLWFWGSKKATETAWRTIQDFAEVMGLELNTGKTGSIVVDKAIDGKPHANAVARLPLGDISWGFLKMTAMGTWTLDDTQIETHIREIRTQLSACKSIFAWVQAWNLYVTRFLSNNFGEPANCVGRLHIDMTIQAFGRIQKGIFGTHAGALSGENVLDHLRGKLRETFGSSDLPDGFFYLPVELGGLGLRNPLIPLLLVHKNVEKNPVDIIERAFELEEMDYNNAKKNWEQGLLRPHHQTKSGADPFPSFEEYVAHVEETSKQLRRAYVTLLESPRKEMVENTDLTKSEMWDDDCDAYGEWVRELYGGEVVKRYGGLAMGEASLLPIGLVNMLKGEKIRWQG